MQFQSPYSKTVKILDYPFISCVLYTMVPGGVEKKHFHDGIEIEYVLSGNSSTHQSGKLYVRRKGEVHEGHNDSEKDLVFVCITIPAETEDNTHYVD